MAVGKKVGFNDGLKDGEAVMGCIVGRGAVVFEDV